MKKITRALPCIILSLIFTVGFTFAGENVPTVSKRADQPTEIKVVPWGPAQSDVDKAKKRVGQSAAVQNKLRGTKHRLIGFEYVGDSSTDKSLPSQPPTRYRVFFYDYTNDRTIIAESDFAERETIKISEEFYDPGVAGKELEAAFQLIKRTAEFGKLAEQDKLEFFEPMPPISNLRGERLVNVGIKNSATGESQIVGVSFKTDKVVRYENNAPPTARVAPENCGVVNAGQGSSEEGLAGQNQISISQGGVTTWEMLVVRPSSSSGRPFERSGLEIRDVKYKGKSVLKRGHAPILTVKYVNDTCGPFRDWQYSEGFFDAPATGAIDPSPGIRVLGEGQIATTVVESGNDFGNFQGVAIYRQNVGFGTEVVMVTEMVAGWYRYIMEWRFAPDGTIRPRYGFGSITNSCVCAPRNHHVYWRFDFDVVNPINKVFKVERGRKFLTPITTEAAIFRKFNLNRGLLIQNSTGDEAYQITPNLADGTAGNAAGVLTDAFGAGDFWVMRFKGTANEPEEIDDPNPLGATDPNQAFAANLAPWINGESVANQDIVVWYGAHQFRDDEASRSASPEVLQGRHIVGPDLRPVRW